MADKKEIKKTKTPSEKDKVSLEEIKKKREEVLARIDAEIGDEKPDAEAVVEKDPKEESVEGEEEKKEEFEKEMLEEEKIEESDKEEEKEKDDREPESEREDVKEEEVIEESENTSEKEVVGENSGSTFSAAEFGLVDSRKGSKGKNIILFIVVFLLVAIISSLFYLFSTGALKFEPKEEEVVPTETPTPTPTPIELNRADVSIQVLNGSGISGEAGRMETYLEGLGYEDIEIGNADNSDYQNVTISIKEEFVQFVQFIIDDISGSYIVDEDYEILDEESEHDVVVIIGAEEQEVEEDN